jgi:hypothetical protein
VVAKLLSLKKKDKKYRRKKQKSIEMHRISRLGPTGNIHSIRFIETLFHPKSCLQGDSTYLDDDVALSIYRYHPDMVINE